MKPLYQELVCGALFIDVSPDDRTPFVILPYVTGSSVAKTKSIGTGKQSDIRDPEADVSLWGGMRHFLLLNMIFAPSRYGISYC